MADFLNHIMTKTFDQQSDIQPRALSRFEPDMLLTPQPSNESDGNESDQPQLSSLPPTTQDDDRSQHSRNRLESDDLSHPVANEPQRSQPTQPQNGPPFPKSNRANLFSRDGLFDDRKQSKAQPLVEDQRHHITVEKHIQPIIQIEHHTTIPPIDPAESRSTEILPVVSEPMIEASAKPVVDEQISATQKIEPQRITHHIIERHSVKPDTTLLQNNQIRPNLAQPMVDTPERQAQSIKPQIRPAPTHASFSQTQPSAQIDTPPVIQVSIGRIEIKATSLPQPAQKSKAPSPVMSLDEYLRQRSEGSR